MIMIGFPCEHMIFNKNGYHCCRKFYHGDTETYGLCQALWIDHAVDYGSDEYFHEIAFFKQICPKGFDYMRASAKVNAFLSMTLKIKELGQLAGAMK